MSIETIKERSFVHILLLLIFLTFTACQYDVPKDPQTLVWHMGAEPDTLNPITSTDAYASRIQGFVFDTLIERDNETLAWKAKMAEKWEVSPDGRTFTFYLRQGIKWHDGYPFNTDDVIYSFDRIMDPKVDAPHQRVYYQQIKKIEKISDLIVRFTYKEPYFLALEFCGGIPLVPKHLYDKKDADFNTNPLNRSPIGMGPYRFVSWETGRKIVLERNEDYWGKAIGKFPEIKKISFEVVSEDTVALQLLKKGELDFAGLRPIQWMRQTDTSYFKQHFNKYKFDAPGYSFIGWNNRSIFFKDANVRKAMTHLVNRESILEKLNFGLGTIVTGPFYYKSPDYNPRIKALNYDVEEAKRLLDIAGWIDHDGDGIRDKDGHPFEFEFLIPSGRRFAERLGNILKEDLKKVGIIMSVRPVEWALFTKELDEHHFDAVTLSWVFGVEQDPYQVWHSSQAIKGSNFVGFSNKDVDKIIEESRLIFDRERRSKLYQRMHEIIDEEQPYTFLFGNPYLVALHKRFENVNIYPGGMDPLEWKMNSEVAP